MGSDLLDLIDLWIVHGMLIGQTVFVATWLTLPWWREWVGRALMVKSVSLLLLFAVAIGNYWVLKLWGPYLGWEYVTLASHVLVLVGIWSQVLALAHEIRSAKDNKRRVTGTEKTRT